MSTNEGATILAGRVSSTKVMLRAGEIATASMPKTQVINLLQVPGGSESQQVMLQVRFAEVNRRKLTEAGLSLIALRNDFYGRSTTQQFAAPDFDAEKPDGMVFSDFLNLFLFDRKHGVGGVLKALQSTGGFQSLAEPNLIAYNGQEASFLAGGEFPIPVVQGGTSNAVTSRLQGVRYPADLHTHDRRRRDSAEGEPRGQLAGFQQRTDALRASAFPRSSRAARRRTSSSETDRRSRLPGS